MSGIINKRRPKEAYSYAGNDLLNVFQIHQYLVVTNLAHAKKDI